MKCEATKEQLIDVVYGEMQDPKEIFKFFDHVNVCQDCSAEFLELLETREMLQQMEPPGGLKLEPPETSRPRTHRSLRSVWLASQKIAAMLLMVFGAIWLFQAGVSLIGGAQSAPDPGIRNLEILQTMRALLEDRLEEERRSTGLALIELIDQLDNTQRARFDVVYQDMETQLVQANSLSIQP